ncbi:MAG: PD40 domain-containing protein [Phaeodactylibacter sp.]|nr:PD40 domain-containing protein [Phaeodactylibacter sp.]MCB9300041.1 PD40 domain-containing protein [Lewinellaceae bacterium]
MSKCLILLFLSLLASVFAHAQGYRTDKEVDKKSLKYYEEAKGHLNASRYAEALEALQKALQKAPDFIDARLMYADLLLQTKDYKGAEAEFETAIALAPDYAPLAYYFLGQAEFELQQFEEAAQHIEHYLESGKARGNRLEEATQLLASAGFAAEAIKKPVPFQPKSLGPGVNTANPEYLPSLSADGQFLVYTTRVDGQNEDIFISQRGDSAWLPGHPVEALNTPANDSSPGIAANGKAMVFARNDRNGNFDLYFSTQRNGSWTTPQRLPAPISTNAWESQPSLSADGQELYFVSDRAGGQGRLDLWMSRQLPGGSWGAPQNLGPTINTPLNEQAPFIHPDGQTLYFMSKGHPGMGQYDLFLSRRQADGSWGPPKNLGYPINTANNEGALIVSLDGKTAYFDTDRLGPTGARQEIGNADLFSFELYPEVRPQPATYAKIVVRDAITKRPLPAEVDIVKLKDGATFTRGLADEKGTFLAVLPLGENYALNVSKTGYLFQSENFALAEATDFSQPFLLEIELSPLAEEGGKPVVSKPVILRNIFFETGSAALRPESTTELNYLKGLLLGNPTLKIQVNGHTDNVGAEVDNQRLSEARAKAVYDYLVAQGISPGRLRYKGFGESQPIAPNDTEEGRQQNRRTEFVVVE